GVDISAYAPPGFHPHATPLHHAVDSGSLAAVTRLIEAGADRGVRDRVYDGTPLDWAEHLKRDAIAAYLRRRGVEAQGGSDRIRAQGGAMFYTFTVDRKPPGYLHVKVSGDNTPETVLKYLGEVRAACERLACPYVLIEESLRGPRLDTLDIFAV